MGKYTIQNGDTLEKIAKKNNTTVSNLAKINNIKDPNKIYAGATINVSADTGDSGNSADDAGMGFQYDKFEYDDYTPSDTVNGAYAALQSHMQNQPGAYASKWQDQINEIIGNIQNREEFSYDINNDALYQQYKDQYNALGKLAMQDTMGQAAAMTGGYGSSYASSAGNQAYQQYLSQLNEVVPELYGMARDQYNQEGQELYNQYGLLADQENQDYGRYMDSYNQWASERDHLQGVYSDERAFDYGKHADERDFAYGQYSDDKNYAYNEYRNAIADQQWQQQFDESVRQHNASLAESQRQFNEQMAFQKQQYEDAKSSGNGQAALEHVSSMSSEDLVSAMQAYSYDNDDTGLESFLDDCVSSGRLTLEQSVAYWNRYCTPSARIDTTVKSTGGSVSSGGLAKDNRNSNYLK